MESKVDLASLAELTGAEVVGDPGLMVSGIASLAAAGPGEISHLSAATYRAQLSKTKASAVILAPEHLPQCPCAALVTDNPRLAYALISQVFAPPLAQESGIDASARVSPDACIAETVSIGSHVCVGPGVVLEDQVVLMPGVVVERDCRIGAGTRIGAQTVLCAGARIGKNCLIHPNATLGGAGFGYVRAANGRQVRIEQLGGLLIGDDVDIGAGVTIDRGALDDTRIDSGVKIDSQAHIGHNCHIGADSVICGCVGIAGSSVIGKRCLIGGGVGIGGGAPVVLCDEVVITGMTHVARSISKPGVYSGGVAQGPLSEWRRNALRFRELDSMHRRLRDLERQIQRLTAG